MQNEEYSWGDMRPGVVAVGRTMGFLAIALAILLGIKFSGAAHPNGLWSADGFWVFTSTIITPFGILFLIFMVTEVVKMMGKARG